MPATMEISTLHFKSYSSLSQSLSQHSQRGRVIIITGGGRGIGLSIAQAFAGAGALSVHLLGRTASSLRSAKKDLSAQYTSCKIHTHAIDIAAEGDVNEAFEGIRRSSIEEREVSGYTLIHSAAFLPMPEDLDQISQESRVRGLEWWKTFEINVNGTFLVFQAFSNLVSAVPSDCVEDRDGRPDTPRTTTDKEAVIINLVSASAYAFTAAGTSAYAASKLAAMRIMECAACEGMAKSHRTRIVNLHPGAVRTEMWEKSGGESVGIPCNDGKCCIFYASSLPFPRRGRAEGVGEGEGFYFRRNQ